MSNEVKAVAPVMTAQVIEGESGTRDGVPPPAPRISNIGSDAKERGDIVAEMKDAADDARPEDSESWETGSVTELDGVRQPAAPRVRLVRPPPKC